MNAELRHLIATQHIDIELLPPTPPAYGVGHNKAGDDHADWLLDTLLAQRVIAEGARVCGARRWQLVYARYVLEETWPAIERRFPDISPCKLSFMAYQGLRRLNSYARGLTANRIVYGLEHE